MIYSEFRHIVLMISAIICSSIVFIMILVDGIRERIISNAEKERLREKRCENEDI